MTRAVRGAIQVADNSVKEIGSAAVRLVTEVLRVNGIAENQIVSIIFSMTDDLHAANPAAGLRTAGFRETPLFCVQEARVDGGLPRTIRVLLSWESDAGRSPRPVYLDGARALRPDLGEPSR